MDGSVIEFKRDAALGAGKSVVVAGLGLIGGSVAKALKQYTGYTVYGWNRTASVAEQAAAEGAIDAVADDEAIARCDLLIAVLYPEATVDFLKRTIPQLKPGAMVLDMVGVKRYVTEELTPVALEHGVRFTGGHPMAGLARAGYGRAFPDLFRGASMILTPTAATGEGDVEELCALFRQLGFGRVKLCTPETHDRMIAHTSQLAHVVSNCYVKSPVSAGYVGFNGGSYKDMTRIACLNEKVWAELFLKNREDLVTEIDLLLDSLTEVRRALAAEDRGSLERLLREGREAKERIDALNPDQPSS